MCETVLPQGPSECKPAGRTLHARGHVKNASRRAISLMRSLRPQPDRRRDPRREADLERDLWAWNVLAPLSGGYAPWTEGSLAPRALVAVLNEIVFSDRDTILECGGGTSTFFIGRLLKALGRGRLLTVEHSDQWARWLDRHLSHEGLGEHVKIVRAPLETTPVGWNPTSEWYRADVGARLGARPKDVIIRGDCGPAII
jgi:hypothetical protein